VTGSLPRSAAPPPAYATGAPGWTAEPTAPAGQALASVAAGGAAASSSVDAADGRGDAFGDDWLLGGGCEELLAAAEAQAVRAVAASGGAPVDMRGSPLAQPPATLHSAGVVQHAAAAGEGSRPPAGVPVAGAAGAAPSRGPMPTATLVGTKRRAPDT